MAERATVAGSRPIARQASSSWRNLSATSAGSDEVTLNSSAHRAASRIERGRPWPPTMIGGRPPPAARGRGEQGVLDGVVAAAERPARRLFPEAVDDLELLFEHLGAHVDGREGE